MHFNSAFITAALLAVGSSSPIEERQSCPQIHIFGARETTAPVGYGSAGTFVDLIKNAYPGSSSEAISYPATGGSSYSSSAATGVQNIANQINAFNKKCPSTKLVVVGYSQGAQIGDTALCGGGVVTAAAATAIKAVIWAGNPRNSPAETFHYGTCKASGFAARPAGFSCPAHQAKIRSYCDAPDPYCCNGNSAATHQGYGKEYGQNALAFVKTKLG